MSWGLYGLNLATDTVSQGLPPVQFIVSVSNRLDFLLASRRGGYWRLADGRIQQWRTNHLERDLGPYPWGDAKVNAACEDNDGNLVVGTEGAGVFWYDAQGKAAAISAAQGLSHGTVLSVCVDREGDLWVGTDGGGLNRVRHQTFTVLEDTRGSTVQSVCDDGTGGLWIGAFGGGLKHWHNGRMEQIGSEQGLANNFYVRAVFLDRNQRLWVGADLLGLFQVQDGVLRQILSTERVSAIVQDRHGSLLVGTDNGLWSWDGENWGTLSTSNGLSANEVTAIAQDTGGDLWIGTARGGLNRVHEGKVTVYRKSEISGLPSDSIASLSVDDSNGLWAGTAGGVARLRAGQWTAYSSRDGLPSDDIGYLLDDARGELWMGSYVGLIRVTKKVLDNFGQPGSAFIPIRSYGQSDGLLTRECTFGSQPAACRTADGRLWFPTIKGLVSVNPAQLRPNTNPPPVVIEGALINGLAADPNRSGAVRSPPMQSVTLPPGKGRLEIQFTSLNLAAPDKARFKYRLENYEQSETEAPGNLRPVIARYPKLPPGDYEFHVTACNEDGVWNPAGTMLSVIVLPQFWQTWWFRAAAAATLLGLIVSAVHYVSTQRLQRQLASLRQREALEKERARIARDIHDQLGASLTQVALLGELVEADKNTPGEVEQHARQISETARETTLALDEIVWTVNPSNDTLDGLITYVCKSVQDYLTVAGVRHRIDVPTQLPGSAISPEVRHNVFLAAKEAVTNVVRHARATEVWLRLRLEAGRFTLEIQDNGRGLGNPEEAARTRNGLRNMRKRLEDVGGTFDIGAAPEGGTVVRLTAPIAQPQGE
jgi:signal transduction histidine kinase